MLNLEQETRGHPRDSPPHCLTAFPREKAERLLKGDDEASGSQGSPGAHRLPRAGL